jgi:hypothetical protein
MADRATLTDCLVLIHERTALLCVTLEAGFIFAQECKPAGFQLLLNIRRRTFDRDPFVRLMTIAATHLAFEHRMVMRQCERGANFQVTLETCFRRFSWIYDRAGAAACFDVQTPWTVTRLAPHVLCVFTFCLQSRVRGCSEIAYDFFVASLALFCANELRTGDAGRSKNCSIGGAAGKQNYGQRGSSSGTP